MQTLAGQVAYQPYRSTRKPGSIHTAFPMPRHGQPMPLAFHNTSFGRSCSTSLSSSAGNGFDASRIMSPISFAFRYTVPASSEGPGHSGSSWPRQGSLPGLQGVRRHRANALDTRFPAPSENEVQKYQSLPLPPTPTSEVTVLELGETSLPTRSADELQSGVSQTLQASGSNVNGNEGLQTVHDARKTMSRDFSTPAQDTSRVSFISERASHDLDDTVPLPAVQLNSQPNVPLEPMSGLLPDLDDEKSIPSWLRRVRNRTEYMLQWISQYRED